MPILLLSLAAALSAAGAPPPDWSTARELEVRLTSFKFTPARIELRSGEAYRLHLVNAAKGGHNFDAAAFFAAADVATADRSKLRSGAIELKGGRTADVRFVAPAPGTYKLRCSHFLHTGLGMTAEIVVR